MSLKKRTDLSVQINERKKSTVLICPVDKSPGASSTHTHTLVHTFDLMSSLLLLLSIDSRDGFNSATAAAPFLQQIYVQIRTWPLIEISPGVCVCVTIIIIIFIIIWNEMSGERRRRGKEVIIVIILVPLLLFLFFSLLASRVSRYKSGHTIENNNFYFFLKPEDFFSIFFLFLLQCYYKHT